MAAEKKSVGIIINPIAGLGGRVGLKGSDGADTVERALALGGKPESPLRAGKAIEQLLEIKDKIEVYTYGGPMGEEKLRELGFEVNVVGQPAAEKTTAADTIAAAKKLRDAGVDLIVFAGGDGTARNVCEAVGLEVPVIGIPAGVKIHSAVYAINPRNAGLAAKEYLEGKIQTLNESEVMDIDEELFREGRVSAKLYGYMNVPASGSRIQNMKSGGGSEEGDLAGMAGHIVVNMEPDTIYIIGPGSTTRSIMEDLGLPNTLLGVDVVKDKKLIASDVTEPQLWEMIKDPERKVKIIVTVIGGQGNIFGRGNQQISPRIIRRVGKENIIVAATASKLIALNYQPLLVDTGDAELDEELSGFIEVVVAFGQTSVYSVSS
ncbi:ATP-NAD kinase family protein [Ruminococcaceae bacterium OttesenSCG-928-I18]|nr:ATP-NAD kinase family protein [Ruminococcaceae bacterium OttesenSCG-928-I18]